MHYNKKNQSVAAKDGDLIASNSRHELPLIRQGEQLLIDARLVHQKLKVGRDFSTWIKARIEEFGFEPGKDFFSAIDSPNWGNQKGRGGDRRSIQVCLTLDMAKELCMVERNEQGRAMRRYFIEAEKKLRGIVSLGKERELLKGVKPKRINDRLLYPYREVLERCGYPVNSNSDRRRRFWGQFVKEGNLLYCTDLIAAMLYANRQAINRRQEALQAQPVLPLGFGDDSMLAKGDRHD